MTATTATVTVIVPTHDHPATLDLAVASALEQTFGDLEVVIIGDGVGDDTRDVAAALVATDARVRFLDRPKSPSRSEAVRHEVLVETASSVVAYLGDDDLLLPGHVETMVTLLEGADFAHPLPFAVNGDGSLHPHPTDLARPECRQWHLQLHPRRNCVSLTGATHRVDAYRRLPAGWRNPPPDRWSDHFMWEQWFTAPGMRFATAGELTMLKFDAWMRDGWDGAARRAELLDWKHRSRHPGFADELRGLALEALRGFAVQSRLDLAELEDRYGAAQTAHAERIATLDAELAGCRQQLARVESAWHHDRADLDGTRAALDDAQGELARVRSTVTWRARGRVTAAPVLRPFLARRRRRARAGG